MRSAEKIKVLEFWRESIIYVIILPEWSCLEKFKSHMMMKRYCVYILSYTNHTSVAITSLLESFQN
jgi:hypothetical protein